MALEEFTVTPAFASGSVSEVVDIDWPKVVADVERAMTGRLAIDARVAERASTYRRRLRSADTGVRIRFDDSVDDATLLEVDAPDAVGLLYRVTRALADLDVDIRLARVETLTDRVVDAFTLTDGSGAPIVDADFRAEVERAVRHAAGG
jgi:[protein-PII] uridylyltransferase